MKILIIEDDPFFRNYFVSKLREVGFLVEAAVDGQEGLEKIKTIKPDLVLLDIIMPNKDGFEVLTTMNSNPTNYSIPVIVFSTLGQEDDVKKAISLGAKDYINKSFFDFNKIKAKINHQLNIKK